MSRSRKKPYIGTCGKSRGAMKKWKKKNNQRIRRMELDEFSSCGFYKKLISSWLAPDDGKHLCTEKWASRK